MVSGQVASQNKYKKRREELLASQKTRDANRSDESKARHNARDKAIREAAKKAKAKLQDNLDCNMADILFKK